MYRDSETGLVFHHGQIGRSPLAIRLLAVTNVLFGALYVLFGVRFVLEYVQARPVPFVALIHQWSNVFLAAFYGIVPNGHDRAGHPLAWWILAGAVAYLLLHVLIAKLLRMINHAPHAEL